MTDDELVRAAAARLVRGGTPLTASIAARSALRVLVSGDDGDLALIASEMGEPEPWVIDLEDEPAESSSLLGLLEGSNR